MSFTTFVLSKFRTNLLAVNYLIVWERTKFDIQQKSSKFLFKIMTLFSSENNIGSDIEFIPMGR